MSEPATVEEYVAALPDGARPHVEQVVAAVRRALPGAEERIRYGMPAFMFAGRRYGLHVAGWTSHVGLYPVARLDPELEAEVAPYRSGKDTVKLLHRDGMPVELVERIARALAAQHA